MLKQTFAKRWRWWWWLQTTYKGAPVQPCPWFDQCDWLPGITWLCEPIIRLCHLPTSSGGLQPCQNRRGVAKHWPGTHWLALRSCVFRSWVHTHETVIGDCCSNVVLLEKSAYFKVRNMVMLYRLVCMCLLSRRNPAAMWCWSVLFGSRPSSTTRWSSRSESEWRRAACCCVWPRKKRSSKPKLRQTQTGPTVKTFELKCFCVVVVQSNKLGELLGSKSSITH